MDKLPTAQELKFKRAQKSLYLRLSTVIRSLSTKFENRHEAEVIRSSIDNMRATPITEPTLGSHDLDSLSCIMAEIESVVWEYNKFIGGGRGGKWATKKTERGIERLEYLRDNWGDLTIIGDNIFGYRLVRQPTES